MLNGNDALIIQDVSEIVALMTPIIHRAGLGFIDPRVTIKDCIEWIIAEEIERIYLLAVNGHYKGSTRSTARAYVANRLPLTSLVAEYVKVPKLYNNINITLALNTDCLYIWYKR